MAYEQPRHRARSPFWKSLAVFWLALSVAACSSSTTGAEGASTNANGTNNALEGVTVPDAFTPLTIAPISRPTFPFPGTDGKYHLAYDVQITNATGAPAALTSVDVVDAQDPSKVLTSFSGTQLVDPKCSYGNCNRLRQLTGRPSTDFTIPPQGSRALLLDFTFDKLAQFPKAVMLRLHGTGVTAPGSSAESGPLDTLGAPFDISAGTPRVISPPLRGNNWVAFNGCCEPGWAHRDSILPLNMKLNNSQRFAIDWMRTNDQGNFSPATRPTTTAISPTAAACMRWPTAP